MDKLKQTTSAMEISYAVPPLFRSPRSLSVHTLLVTVRRTVY